MGVSLGVFKDANATRLFGGQLISQACDKMMSVGLVWVISERFSTDLIPWFLGVSALPHLLLSMHAGKWGTRLGPLRTLIWTDVVRGVLFLILASLWHGLDPGASLTLLFVFTFLAGCAGALFNPAILSLPVFLPDQSRIQQLTALIDSCFSYGNILGPLLSALLYPVLGLQGLFVLNGASYLFAAVLEAGIRMAPQASSAGSAPAGTDPAGAGTEQAATGNPLRSDRLLTFMLMAFLAINLFLGPLMVFLPLFVKETYLGDIRTLSWLEMAIAVGMVGGGTFLSVMKLDARVGRKITAGMGLVALAYLGFSFSRQPWVGIFCLTVLGFFLSTVNIFSITLFQVRPRPADVPSVMAWVNLISVASLPVSMALVGFLIRWADSRSLAQAFGGILLLVTFGVISNRELRSYVSPS